MMFTEVPFIERSAAAREAGFDAVEFLFPCDHSPQQIQQQLMQNHLTLTLFSTALGDINTGEWGLSALPGCEHEARADVDLVLEYALALSCGQVHVMLGVVPAGEDAERYRAVFIDNLRYVADHFAPHSKRILVETPSSGVKPYYLFSNQYQALAVVEEVARDNMSTQLDTLRTQKIDGSLTHLVRDYAGKHAYVRIARLLGRHEPDDGKINYPWLFHLFDEVGYQGRIDCEYKPHGLTEEGLGWLDAWR